MNVLTMRRLTVFLLMVFLAFLANLLVPGMFWETYGSDLLQNLACFCAGGLVAEACLSAIWGAMAAGQMKYRIPISAGLVLLAACFYVLGLQLPDLPDSDMPLEVALLVIGLSILMYAALLLPLWFVRRLARLQIAVPGEDFARASKQPGAQFGLRYLLMCPVVVSGIIILLQYSLPQTQNLVGPGMDQIVELLFGAGVFLVFSMLICVPCIWLVLTDKRRWTWGIWLGIVWFVGPWCILALLQTRHGIRDILKSFFAIGMFGTGLLTTILLVLFIFRLLGYRLIGPRGESPFRTIGVETVEGSRFKQTAKEAEPA